MLLLSGDEQDTSFVELVFTLRHSMSGHNKGDGINLRGWDAHVLDNWLSDNGKAGFASRFENEGASVAFTANRVEWNKEENMLLIGSVDYQITGTTLTVPAPAVWRCGAARSIRRAEPQSLETSLIEAGRMQGRGVMSRVISLKLPIAGCSAPTSPQVSAGQGCEASGRSCGKLADR
jgi:hypothetical protein